MGITNNRQYKRVPFYAGLEVKDKASARLILGSAIDLSRGGLRFFSRECFPVGTSVELAIRSKLNPAYVMRISATITCDRIESFGATMGAAFDSELSPMNQPDLWAYLDSKLRAVTTGERVA